MISHYFDPAEGHAYTYKALPLSIGKGAAVELPFGNTVQ